MEKVKGNKIIYNLRAESMKWDTASKKWIMSNAAERYVDSMKERITYHPNLTLNISLKPEELRKDYYLKDKLTTPELVAFIKKGRSPGYGRVECAESGKLQTYSNPCRSFIINYDRGRYCQPENPGRKWYAPGPGDYYCLFIYPV